MLRSRSPLSLTWAIIASTDILPVITHGHTRSPLYLCLFHRAQFDSHRCVMVARFLLPLLLAVVVASRDGCWL